MNQWNTQGGGKVEYGQVAALFYSSCRGAAHAAKRGDR